MAPSRPSISRFTFGHCKPASAGKSQGPCTSSAGDRTETADGPSGTRAASQAGRSRRRIGARERCLSSTDVGNPGKADNRSRSDRSTRPRSMGTGRARRSRAGAPGGFSGRSCPLFTRGGWRSRQEANQGWPRSLSLRLIDREVVLKAPRLSWTRRGGRAPPRGYLQVGRVRPPCPASYPKCGGVT